MSFNDRKRVKDLMLMLGMIEAMDHLGMANSVPCAEEGGQLCLEKGITFKAEV